MGIPVDWTFDPTTAMHLRPGAVLQDRYEIRSQREDRGEGRTWTATDLRLGREVVLRCIVLPPPEEAAAFAELERRKAALAAHGQPHLQTLLDFVYFAGCAYTVTKPTLGRSLADRLWEGPFGWLEARALLERILALLEITHARGLPHLRLDPAAVVLEADGSVSLRHFSLGAADLLRRGDPHRAPEMERGEGGPAADLYAVGALVPDLLGPDPEDLPEEALRFQRFLSHPDPAQRPASAKAARALLASPAAAPRRRPRGAFPALFLLAAALLGWGALHLRHGRVLPDQLDPDSRAAYLQAREHFARRTADDLQKAGASYQAVLARQPDCAEASSGLAVVQALEGVYGLMPREEAMTRARASAEAALARDARSGEAAAVQAYLDMRFEWRWEQADAEFRKAVAWAPDSALVRHWRGFQLSLAGRHREALEQLELAHHLDPVERQITTNLAVAKLWAGDAKGGLALLQDLIYHDPHFFSARDRLRLSLEAEGRMEEAMEEAREMVRLGHWDPDLGRALEEGWRMGGARGYLLARLAQVRHPRTIAADPYFEAQVLAMLGDRDGAFRALNAAIARKSLFAVWGPQDTALRSLHGDPRWQGFLDALNYPKA